MFYKQFLKIIDVIDEKFVEEFDFWLATLSAREARTISISAVSSRFGVRYGLAKAIVKFAEDEGILKKRYIVICKNEDCEFYYQDFDSEELIKVLGTTAYCHNCSQEFQISYENTIIVYSKEKEPNIPETLIEKEIAKRVGDIEQKNFCGNFTGADSLGQDINEIYDLYYKPDESAYEKMKQLQKSLDGPFTTTKEKGDSLEELALYLFKMIKNISGTNKITTYTNQFDCTMRFSETSESFPSVMQYMSPYFIVECKNETEASGKGKTPSNTYFHKLSDIMSSNEAQIGIVFSRGNPSREDINIARENYLTCRNSKHQKFLISISNNDLEAIIDKKVNLLKYISFKVDMLTMNAKNGTYEMFEENENK